MLTVEDVERQVEKIRAMKGDPEGAHSEEDDMIRRVLYEISNEDSAAGDLATAAVKSYDISFPRWCA
jgi:hypothetical protein